MIGNEITPAYEGDLDNGALGVPPDEVEVAAEEQEGREDWKARAIAAQTRLQVLEEMRQQQQQQAPAEPVDEVTRLRMAIEEKRKAVPALDDKNPQSFWDRERAKEELETLQGRLMEARLRQQEQVLAEQQVGGLVQQYKARFSTRPSFKAVEPQFDQMVNQLQPHLRGNAVMLDMIRSKLELDYMERSQGRKKAPSTPDGAFQPQAQARPQQGKVAWRTDEDRRVGEYYMSRGIIAGPEDFYNPRFNERSATANNNGVAIYDLPDRPRGWRR